ncbi:MAG: DNA translocase FtsK [Syntrophomonadaceae bacterium]|nr:DNA translocase FtsK [Syntrophomonadaceae bacterium]
MEKKEKAQKAPSPKNKTQPSPRKKPLAVPARAQAAEMTPKPNRGIQMEIISMVLLMLAAFVYVSLTRFQGTPDETRFIGLLGSTIMKGFNLLFGRAAIAVPLFMLAWAIHIGVLKEYWSTRMWGITLLAVAFLVYMGMYHIPGGKITPMEAGMKGMGGGYIGGALATAISKLIGGVGMVILIFLSVLVAISLAVDKSIFHLAKDAIGQARHMGSRLSDIMYYEEDIEPQTETPVRKPTAPLIIEPQVEQPMLDFQTFVSDAGMERPKDEAVEIKKTSRSSLKLVRNDNDEAPIYQKPPLDLLSSTSNERTIDKKNIKESITVLEETFTSFGIQVKVNQVSCGPAVTRYELTPAPGVKISRILALTDDLQLNLAAAGIRIEAPIPGKAAVGIEVPNNKILSVGLRNLLTAPVFSRLNSPLAIALGEDITGNTVVTRLNDMPHMLIAGSTGSGKSVCLNCIIMSLLYNASPEELRLVFIDPKMVELTVYNGIPHLLTPVVTDPKKASVVLRWMTNEMEKRYRLFAEKGVRDITRYNQTAKDKLPYIVIIIDELADLMMVSPVEVEDSICRLAQMARAAGMHLIVATQRPSVDVVTGIIKANIPSRIAFAVSSQADSRTILDIGGAEKLLGKGDMLFLPVGASKPQRVQGAYVSDQDIENTVEFIKSQSIAPDESQALEELEFSMAQADNDEGDDLYWDAVNIFVDAGKASVSMLQRRLRIGYARAARLVDLMEDRGIVSELDNNKKREVLLDRAQLDKIQSRNIFS